MAAISTFFPCCLSLNVTEVASGGANVETTTEVEGADEEDAVVMIVSSISLL